MSKIQICTAPGCETLTLGTLCKLHAARAAMRAQLADLRQVAQIEIEPEQPTFSNSPLRSCDERF